MRNKAVLIVACITLSICCCPTIALAQQPKTPTVTSWGYTPPELTALGRGQVITLYLYGIESQISQPVIATSHPLPTSLANISVKITPDEVFAPILSVEPAGNFAAAVVIQIPYELTFIPEVVRQRSFIVIENGNAGPLVRFSTDHARIHILKSWDYIFLFPRNAPYNVPVVVHEDGSLVTAETPAKVGEMITIHAVGLGATNPSIRSGEIPPTPLPLARPLVMNFDFTPNAPPRDIRELPEEGLAKPIFAGLAPGKVGLYHVTFKVPPISRGTTRCGGSVISNLTVTIAIQRYLPPFVPSGGTFDGVGICVDVGSNLSRPSR